MKVIRSLLNQVICPCCKAVLEWEPSDLRWTHTEPDYYYVKCPCCESSIWLKQTERLNKNIRKTMKTGIEQITEERVKQISKYNHTAYTDQCYHEGELLKAAAAYLLAVSEGEDAGLAKWPWHPDSFKNEGYISSLKKAGAFIAAELDRISLS